MNVMYCRMEEFLSLALTKLERTNERKWYFMICINRLWIMFPLKFTMSHCWFHPISYDKWLFFEVSFFYLFEKKNYFSSTFRKCWKNVLCWLFDIRKYIFFFLKMIYLTLCLIWWRGHKFEGMNIFDWMQYFDGSHNSMTLPDALIFV